MKKKKTYKAVYVVVRQSSIPRMKVLPFHFAEIFNVCCIFPTQKGAKKWIEHWNNAKDFRIEKIEMPYYPE